jgi:hypothetical protein
MKFQADAPSFDASITSAAITTIPAAAITIPRRELVILGTVPG